MNNGDTNSPPPRPQRKRTYTVDAYTGHFFFGDEKKNDKWPDCDGSLKIGERTFEIAGWLRKSETTGRDYIFIKMGSEKF